jgi:hypothetical protein
MEYIMKFDGVQSGKYQHYKNEKFYEVIGVVRHSETLEEMVLYKALYHSEKFGDNQLWVRPKAMFLESVEHNGISVPRFKLIETLL